MKNIIITGGELFNKGAQAMTFIAVDELKKRFPEHQIYVLSAMDLKRPQEEKDKYAFRFMGWYPIKFAKCQKNPLLRLICKLRNAEELKEAEHIYKNTDLMVDISGYALSSTWNTKYINQYLEHLEFAKAFGIPMYLLPQSFGPFDFQDESGQQIEKKIKDLLPSVKVICARELEGYHMLKEHYSLNNVCVKGDIVLNNKGINLQNIYNEVPEIVLPCIQPNSVAVIPNGQTIKVGNKEQIFELYDAVINELLGEGKTIYLLSHSTQDAVFCESIKENFEQDERVVYLNRDFSCIEFNELVQKFDFAIASRFHSIVHAYKNGVPCIVLGWAVKYHDLSAMFGQQEYLFDARDSIDRECVVQSIRQLNQSVVQESKKIQNILADIQKENVFDILSMEKE